MIARFIVAPCNFVLTFGYVRQKLETTARLAAVLMVSTAQLGCDRREADLVVFAAASLTDLFEGIGQLVTASDSSIRVRTNFAGSQQLAQQIVQGGDADIFATADERWMQFLVGRELVQDVQPFAQNRLVVVARSGIRFNDLANPEVTIVIGADVVPIGRYTRDVIVKLRTTPGFGVEFAESVLANVVSEEDNVRGVLAKVLLGEADAGFVYTTDVAHLPDERLHVISIPHDVNVSATYFVARTSGTSKGAVETFIRILMSDEGYALVSRHGFSPYFTQ